MYDTFTEEPSSNECDISDLMPQEKKVFEEEDVQKVLFVLCKLLIGVNLVCSYLVVLSALNKTFQQYITVYYSLI